MTDHKTVREALEFYADEDNYEEEEGLLRGRFISRVDYDEGETAIKALAALDRIEAVEVVTVEDIAMCIQDWKFNEENQQPFFGDYLAAKFPNGLRIVKEK